MMIPMKSQKRSKKLIRKLSKPAPKKSKQEPDTQKELQAPITND